MPRMILAFTKSNLKANVSIGPCRSNLDAVSFPLMALLEIWRLINDYFRLASLALLFCEWV